MARVDANEGRHQVSLTQYRVATLKLRAARLKADQSLARLGPRAAAQAHLDAENIKAAIEEAAEDVKDNARQAAYSLGYATDRGKCLAGE